MVIGLNQPFARAVVILSQNEYGQAAESRDSCDCEAVGRGGDGGLSRAMDHRQGDVAIHQRDDTALVA